MGFALVGLGAVATTNAGTISPSFGQATSAHDLLVAWLFSNGSGSTNPFGTSSPGWTLGAVGGAAFGWVACYYRENSTAGETPPSFTAAAAPATFAMLGEFSGAALAGSLDQTGNLHGGPPGTVSCAAADAAGGELIIFGAGWNSGSNGPTTISTSLTGSTGAAVTPNQTDNHTTTGSLFYDFCWGIAGAAHGTSADTGLGTLGVFAGGGEVIASFRAAPAGGSGLMLAASIP